MTLPDCSKLQGDPKTVVILGTDRVVQKIVLSKLQGGPKIVTLKKGAGIRDSTCAAQGFHKCGSLFPQVWLRVSTNMDRKSN